MKLPIVFHPKYDIGLMGLENLHPFDSKKYGKVLRQLQEEGLLSGDNYYQPDAPADDATLLRVHTPAYLQALQDSSRVAAIAELGLLRNVPNGLLQRHLLDPMRWATAGTILGARLAMDFGWAVNLAGGYHHAKAEHCSGFCFFADINLAVGELFAQFPKVRKVMVVDLDAHQGNGFEDLFQDDPRVDTFDMYNQAIYPGDTAAARFIRYRHPLPDGIGEEAYLALLMRDLPPAIDESAPDFIVFNAGTDPYEKDQLGGMRLTAGGIVDRDEFVWKLARARRIPILMLLSGGYHKDSAGIIARSILNLWKKGHLQPAGSIA